MDVKEIYPAKLRKAIHNYQNISGIKTFEIFHTMFSWALLKTTFGFVVVHGCTNKTNSFSFTHKNKVTCDKCRLQMPKDMQVMLELVKE